MILPARCDVLVIGDGLAGLLVAEGLAEAGVDVLVVGDGAQDGESLGAPGLVLPGVDEPPHRLVAGLGLAQAQQIHAHTQASAASLESRGWLRRVGVAWLAMRARADLSEVAEAWRALGLHPTGIEGGLWLPEAGEVAPRAVLDHLGAGAPRLRGWVGRITEDPLTAWVDGRPLRCELVVLAGGWRQAALDPWLGDKLYAVGRQVLVWRGQGGPVTAGLGWGGGFGWLPTDGGLRTWGARWADPAGTRDAVVAMQTRIVAERWPGLSGPPGGRSSAMSFTCDRLPIVGPLPGRTRLVACCGWNGRPFALAPAAAGAVVQGILTGQPSGLPSSFSARRFV